MFGPEDMCCLGLKTGTGHRRGGYTPTSLEDRSAQVAEEIWVVQNKGVTKWRDGIEAYKEHLKATHSVRASVAVLG